MARTEPGVPGTTGARGAAGHRATGHRTTGHRTMFQRTDWLRAALVVVGGLALVVVVRANDAGVVGRFFTLWAVVGVTALAALQLAGARGRLVEQASDVAAVGSVTAGVVHAWLLGPLPPLTADLGAWLGPYLEHLVVPVLAALHAVTGRRVCEPRLRDVPVALVLPAAYVLVALASIARGADPPYPFLAPGPARAGAVAGVCAVVLGASVLLVVLRRAARPFRAEDAPVAGPDERPEIPDLAQDAPAERLVWVDVAKGGAMIGVVAFHVGTQLWSVGADSRALAVMAVLVQALPLWFVLAALFVHRHLVGPLRSLLARRVVPLLYLYVVWSAVHLAFAVARAAVSRGRSVRHDVLEHLRQIVTADGVLWFVVALAAYLVVAHLVRRVPTWVQLLPPACLSLLVGSGLVTTGSWGADRAMQHLVLFLAGYHLRGPLLRWAERARWTTALGCMTLWGLVVGLLGGAGSAGRAAAEAVGPAFAVPAVLAVMVVLARTPARRPLAAVGRASLVVYVVHLPVVVLAIGVLARLVEPGTLPGPTVVAALLLGTAVGVVVPLGLAGVLARAPWLFAPPVGWREHSGARDVAQVGSASALGAEGRGFESRHPDQEQLAGCPVGMGCGAGCGHRSTSTGI